MRRVTVILAANTALPEDMHAVLIKGQAPELSPDIELPLGSVPAPMPGVWTERSSLLVSS